eukprot:CAMPEP_0119335042 /NCGR_PEP_ID=MMETSP1333-20130426/88565_1 /TAXON_ID=418940 /ORGANISM="Scyphosphaera apsteinii, Strain RCC1455" /LENGTH=296 /DNA_ID=CAMNT_0007345493 /DNA_START=49 /DNA_END=939 /DNA_ORIENTATION=-
MGYHMARNLMATGQHLVVYDVCDGPIRKAKSMGAHAVHSPRAVVDAGANTVITMLPSNKNVSEVYSDPETGLCASDSAIKLKLIDCSTIDPTVACTVGAMARALGHEFFDAPVSGGVGGAENATLTFMVGAPNNQAFERARDVLQLMGKAVVHCGNTGSGQAAKLCNNLVLAVSMLGVAEGMLLGQRLGVDKNLLASIFNTSSARCWSSDTYNPVPGVLDGVPASREWDGGFAIKLMLKDLALAVQAAEDAGVALRGAPAARAAFNEAANHGLAAKDFGAIYRFLEQLSPIPSEHI